MQESHPLAEFRKRQDPPMSREDLAELLGVKRATVHRWETRKRKIDDELLPTVVEKTGIPARDLRPDLVELLETPNEATG